MKRILNGIGMIIAVLALLSLTVMLVGIMLGYFYVGIKHSVDKVSVYTNVCDDTLIKKYNNVASTIVGSEAKQKEKSQNIQTLVDSTKKTHSDFDNDATCRFMAYSAAILNNNVVVAQKELDALVNFSKKGIYPSNTIIDLTSIGSMQARINGLKETQNKPTNPFGSG